ncbi:HesA/MoeB/ThiF family protein [Vulgatibacter incomptus]|uniref:Molybdopterin biosynthesis protein MoeB n=1 Tax=Vulgatibacter incomptus TaxID=1391653 RepID=A0A0K1PE15_9BACT|nr:ThiF family adenylyltransferase [Vulgatibacter incomptus]AKU91750.1 Molybdopterin biosynthesis protein MoeB [Vulgatibacter incomptus]
MLDDPQIERYARHILLQEVGGVGQEKILSSRIHVSGLGEVGCWAVTYLGLAGVGRLILSDPRPVPATGLLPLLGAEDSGRPRDRAAASALSAFNPDVAASIETSSARITDDSTELWLGEGPVLVAAAAGEAAVVGWLEPGARLPCSACPPLRPGLPASPEAASLAGSLAASRALAAILGIEAPVAGLWAWDGGAASSLPACNHEPVASGACITAGA